MIKFRFRVLIGDKGLETIYVSATSLGEAIKKFNLLFYGHNVTVVDIQQTNEGKK